ncbi:MAG: hypothetical protein EOP62_10335 [Sphingomonadales bacterium]|nr:MAG: hypothetical protein EOP62_10335 [Sphingomonadales bacterium]
MNQLIVASLALILTAGSAAAHPQAAKACDLTVNFGSYAMGIDRPTFTKVEQLLARDRGVARSDQQRWGREGEVTICVDTKRRADTTRLYSRIRALFPRKPRGPLTVETASGAKFQSPRSLPHG